MERKMGIYQIINMINNHSYIGQSKDIYKRWNAHRSVAFNSNADGYDLPLYRAIRKYGLENFSFIVIEECEIEELDELEKYWIKEKLPEYNLSTGGQDGSSSQKLTPQQVNEIQNILINDKDGIVSHQELAEKYDVLAEGAIRDINVGRSWFNPNLNYPLHQSKFGPGKKVFHYCCDCGKEINSRAQRCHTCAHKLQYKTNHPTREELKILIRNKSFVSIGKMFNVTDNAVRKWCDKYNLPRKKVDIDKYSDEEWFNI